MGVAAPIRITSKIATAHFQLNLRARAGLATASILPEVASRISRFRSALNSAADWQRMSRSFSKCQPSSYVRLEAYGFLGLSEGA